MVRARFLYTYTDSISIIGTSIIALKGLTAFGETGPSNRHLLNAKAANKGLGFVRAFTKRNPDDDTAVILGIWRKEMNWAMALKYERG